MDMAGTREVAASTVRVVARAFPARFSEVLNTDEPVVPVGGVVPPEGCVPLPSCGWDTMRTAGYRPRFRRLRGLVWSM